ncbi:hypothetical protein [Acinetobacter bereziniae]|uniref:hypothetical protein n=1 Tax=Acinetobacter bereziniae TaxID=106648 RepID=UPI00124CD289|nr:hypothetical protein [Acinetobacter bereziniae]
MSYFSLDDCIKEIKNDYSKSLFEEVHSSYVIGNYRSAIVMLWSVVVVDLVLKLNELQSIYDDKTAENILNNISKEQSKDPKSSKWEFDIIEKFHKELKFFETTEVVHMEYLQKVRHISAHPVIGENDKLYTPTKTEVFSLMQNALQCVLIKEAFFSSRVIEHIIKDMSEIKETLTSFSDIWKYFLHKYLFKMSNIILKKYIFTLWKFSFFMDNKDADDNRVLNVFLLKKLLEERKEVFVDFLLDKKDYISAIKIDQKSYGMFLFLLNTNRDILKYFDLKAVEIIKKSVESEKFKFFHYLSFDDPLSYINYLRENQFNDVYLPSINGLKKDCENNNIIEDFLSLCIEAYVSSNSFDIANNRFKIFIKNNLNIFSFDNLAALINLSDKNDQVWKRSQAVEEHKLIIEKIILLNKNFDFKKFKNFSRGNEGVNFKSILDDFKETSSLSLFNTNLNI